MIKKSYFILILFCNKKVFYLIAYSHIFKILKSIKNGKNIKTTKNIINNKKGKNTQI